MAETVASSAYARPTDEERYRNLVNAKMQERLKHPNAPGQLGDPGTPLWVVTSPYYGKTGDPGEGEDSHMRTVREIGTSVEGKQLHTPEELAAYKQQVLDAWNSGDSSVGYVPPDHYDALGQGDSVVGYQQQPGFEEGGTGGQTVGDLAGNLPSWISGPGRGGSFDPRGGTLDQRNALARIQMLLNQYGLGSLAQWAWDQLINGASEDEISLSLTQRPEYKKRFRAIVDREAAGLPPMSPAEVISYENQAAQLMRAAGLPPGFYDSYDDFADLAGKKNVSMAELSERIQRGFLRVSTADPLVRNAFRDMFGPSGDAALASLFLDADKALPVLEQQVDAAMFAGTGLQFGFVVDRNLAMSAAHAGLPASRGRADWQTAAELNPLFSETASERTDITPQQGVEAVFGIGDNPTAQREAINRRQGQRMADFAGGGGAEITRSGIKGLGQAGK